MALASRSGLVELTVERIQRASQCMSCPILHGLTLFRDGAYQLEIKCALSILILSVKQRKGCGRSRDYNVLPLQYIFRFQSVVVGVVVMEFV